MNGHHTRATLDSGLTLIELMAVLAILAILAAVAVPAISRYSNESEFRGFVKRLVQDLHLARHHSTSRPEDGALIIAEYDSKLSDRYSVQAVTPETSTMAQLKQVVAPSYVEIWGLLAVAALPGTTYSPPGNHGDGMPAEIRFTGTANVKAIINQTSHDLANPADDLPDSSVTIFLRSIDKKHEARVVVYMSTGYTRIFDEW